MFRPIVWIAAAFAAGIALSRAGPLSVDVWLLVGLACAAAGVVLIVVRGPAGVPVLCAVACAGGVLYLRDVHPPPDDPFLTMGGARVTLVGRVTQPAQVREGRTRVVVAPEEIRRRDGVVRALSGRVLVTVRGHPEVRYGDRVRATGRLVRPPDAGNPSEFSYRDHLAAQGIRAILAPGRTGAFRVIERGRGHRLPSAVFALRARMLRFFAEALPGARGALLASLLLGDDGSIAPDQRSAFTRAGLLHVLVVSGAQVGLVMAVFIWLARLLHAPPTTAAVLSLPPVIVFALMAGWVPSVARASVMAVAAGLAMAWGRAYDAAAALAASIIVLLASSPLLLFDPGFQLSVTATWGLLYVAPAIRSRLRVLPQAAGALLSMTVAAQVAVMPVIAHHFMQVSITGLAANLLVVPLVAALVPAGFIAAALGAAATSLGALAVWPLRPMLDAVAFLARFFAGLPGAAIQIPPPALPTVVGFYLLMLLLVEMLHGRLRLRRERILAAGLALLAVVVWVRAVDAGPSHLVITILDVGQGDAIVVRGPSSQTLLIDGGGEVEGHLTGYDVGARRVVPALRRMGVHAIDLVLLSHPHEDHVGGLVAVLQNFRVGLVLDSGLLHPAPSYARFRDLIAARGIPYRIARRGMRVDFGDGVHLAVLLPEEPLIIGSGSDANLNSVVVRLTYGRVAALFTGDMEALNESQLLDLGDELRSTLLKVAHHGSDTGTTEAFVDAVRPAVALISVGALNPFGHPDPDTVAVLEDWGARVYRTDRDGAVIVETDGQRVTVRTVRH